MSNENFYRDLPAFSRFSDSPDPGRYRSAPGDWHLVITDVIGSTRAITEGRYRDVNSLGVASIVAVRNAMPGVEIPYVFGGDGATFLVPDSRLDDVCQALSGVRNVAQQAFELDLRAGVVPVSLLREHGHDILVSKFRSSEYVTLTSLAGEGVEVGEAWVKDPVLGKQFEAKETDAVADLTGFECRWQPVASRRGTVACLLVASAGNDASRIRRIIEAIERIVGTEGGCPVSVSSLRMSPVFSRFREEVSVKAGTTRGREAFMRRLRARTAMVVARFTRLTGATVAGFNAERYAEQVAINTDYRKFDGVLRMVIDVTPLQARMIEAMLEREHALGNIFWGIHKTTTSLMTCMVNHYEGDHLHFIDGADGGYAMAARQLKSQIRDAGVVAGHQLPAGVSGYPGAQSTQR